MEILSSGEQGLVETMSYRELLAARHNAFLTMDIETLVRIAMESRIRADEKLSKKLSDSQLTEIAETKAGDMNTDDIDAVKKMVAGTARSMGIELES
jgi:ribosomal protein L11